MVDLVPVDDDPFTTDVKLTPVDYNPFENASPRSKYYLATHGVDTGPKVSENYQQPILSKPVDQLLSEAKDYRAKYYTKLLDNSDTRYQFFPERMVRSIYEGMVDPSLDVSKGLGLPSETAIEGAFNAAGLVGGAPIGIKPGVASLGSGLIRPMRKFFELKKSVEGEPGYVYHATNAERANEIAETGSLTTHKPHEFTDQSVWPDGATEKRNYFTPTAENTWQFAPEEGSPVLLRIKKENHQFKNENTGDIYSTKPVPASKIEYLDNEGNWKSLNDKSIELDVYHGTKAGDIKQLNPSQFGEFGPGVYTSDNPDTAWAFGSRSGDEGTSIIPFKLKLENPFVVTKQEWMKMNETKTPREIQANLKKKGYDGIIGIGLNGVDKQIIPFDTSKLKPKYNLTPVDHDPFNENKK